VSALELPKSRVDVAPRRLDHQVGAERQCQRAPARAAGAEARARAQVLEPSPLARHEDIARVLAQGKRRQAKTGRRLGRQVLEAVHGAVEGAREKHVLDLADEEALATDGRQLDLQAAIALGPYRHDLGLLAECLKGSRDALGLHQRERASPRPDLERHRRPSPKSSWTSSSHDRGEPARDDSRSLVIGACRILFTIAVDIASIASRVSGVAPGSRARVRLTSPVRMASSRSRSDTMVGITSTSPSFARNFATS